MDDQHYKMKEEAEVWFHYYFVFLEDACCIFRLFLHMQL